MKKYINKLGPAACTFADQGITSAGNFLILIAAARCLETEAFGRFSLGWAVYLFSVGLQNSLITGPMRVLLPEHGDDEEAYLARLDVIQVCMTALIIFGIVGVALALPQWSTTIMGTGVLIASRLQQAWVRQQYLAQLDAVRAMWTSLLAGGPLIVIFLVLVVWTPKLDVALIWAICGFLPLLGWLLMRPKRKQTPLSSSIVIREHRNYGKWLFGSQMMLWLSSQLYPFFIAGILGLAEVAILSACRSLLGFTHVIFQGLNAFCVPRLRRTKINSPGQFKWNWLRFSGLGALLVAPVLLIFIFYPGIALNLVFKGEYTDTFAQSILFWYALIYVFVYFNQMLAIGMQGLKKPQVGLATYTISACLTLSVGPTIVRLYGVYGAIGATALNCLITISGPLLYLYFYKRKTLRSTL